MCDSLLSRVLLFVIPWTSACQASPLSMEFFLRHIWKRQEEHASICISNTLCSWKNKDSETELISYRNVNMYRFWDLNFFFFPLGGGVLLLSQSPLPTFPFTITLSISLFFLFWYYFFSIKQMAFVSFFFFIPGFCNFTFYVCSSIYPPQAITSAMSAQSNYMLSQITW